MSVCWVSGEEEWWHQHEERALKAHCTLFVAVCEHQWNHFFTKKWSFTKHEENTFTLYTLFVIDSSFCENWKYSSLQQKKYFVFVKRPPTLANMFCKKCKTLTNHDDSLPTQHSHFVKVSFVISSSFSRCLRIVCSGLNMSL